MQTLGIFGDSYAADQTPRWGAENAWPTLIKKYYNVKNFAKLASSLEFSINEFIKHHEKFDRVVFITTSHPRVYHPLQFIHKENNMPVKHEYWFGTVHCDEVARVSQPDPNLEKMRFIFEVLEGDINAHYMRTQYTALLEYVLELRPDAVLIPGCGIGTHWHKWNSLGYSWELSYIGRYELHKIDMDPHSLVHGEFRPNHISIHNHEWVLEHILGRLNDKFIDWVPTDTFYFKNDKELKEYMAKYC